ncbi:DUF6760 family protein [Actinomadura sp. DC4]
MASHFHWARAELLALDHTERRRWVAEVDRLYGTTRPHPGAGAPSGPAR